MKNFQNALDVIQRRRGVVIGTLVVGLIGIFFLFQFVPRTYEAASHVLIVNDSAGRDPSVSSIDLPSLASSTVVLNKVLTDLKLPVTLIELKRSVKARVNVRSSIMEIDYRDVNPDRAVAVPNAIADELTRYYEEISTSRADDTIRKLDSAVNAEQNHLRDLSVALATVAAKQPFVTSDKALDTVTARMDDLVSQRRLAEATLIGDSAAVSAVSGDPSTMSKTARHEILQSNPLYQQMSTAASKDAAELAADRAAYTDQYPGLPSLQAKVDAERASLAAEAQRALHSPNAFSPSIAASKMDARRAGAIVSADRARVAALDDMIATERQRLAALPTTSVNADRLRLELDASQANYLALSARRTSAVANRAEALSLGSVVVVDRAVRADAAVVGLGRGKLAVLTAALVLALAIASAFMVEVLDPRLRRAQQIEDLYGSPLIATIGGKQ